MRPHPAAAATAQPGDRGTGGPGEGGPCPPSGEGEGAEGSGPEELLLLAWRMTAFWLSLTEKGCRTRGRKREFGGRREKRQGLAWDLFILLTPRNPGTSTQLLSSPPAMGFSAPSQPP